MEFWKLFTGTRRSESASHLSMATGRESTWLYASSSDISVVTEDNSLAYLYLFLQFSPTVQPRSLKDLNSRK
jgi:hypothetical protein